MAKGMKRNKKVKYYSLSHYVPVFRCDGPHSAHAADMDEIDIMMAAEYMRMPGARSLGPGSKPPVVRIINGVHDYGGQIMFCDHTEFRWALIDGCRNRFSRGSYNQEMPESKIRELHEGLNGNLLVPHGAMERITEFLEDHGDKEK